jgi:hypothetical protein
MLRYNWSFGVMVFWATARWKGDWCVGLLGGAPIQSEVTVYFLGELQPYKMR